MQERIEVEIEEGRWSALGSKCKLILIEIIFCFIEENMINMEKISKIFL